MAIRAGTFIRNGRVISGGGGSGFLLGPLTNEFTSIALRDTYATNNAAWLAQYDANPSFLVQVTVGGAASYYRRNGSAWEDVNGIIGLLASQADINTAVAAAVAAAVIDFRTAVQITTEINNAILAGVQGFQTATEVQTAISTALGAYYTKAEIDALLAAATGGLVRPDADGVLADPTGFFQVGVDRQGNLYTSHPNYTAQVYVTGDFDEWTSSDDADFRGVLSRPPDTGSDGDYFYDSSNHRFRRYRVVPHGFGATEWVNTDISNVITSNSRYVGEFDYAQEAREAIENYNASNRYYAYFDTGTLAGSLYRITNYVAGTPSIVTFEWRRVGAEESARISALEERLSTLAVEILHNLRLTATGDNREQFGTTALHSLLSQNPRARGILEYTSSFNANVASENGTITFNLQHGTTTVATETLTLNSDTEVALEFEATDQDVVDGIFIRTVVVASDSSTIVSVTDRQLQIITEYLPTTDDIPLPDSVKGENIPDAAMTLTDALNVLNALMGGGGGTGTAQYAETNSDDDSDWHTAQATADNWIRFGIGNPAVYTTGIPLAQAGATDITISRDSDSVTVESSTGDDGEVSAATATEAGVATAEQITKLNAIEEEATKNAAGTGTSIGSDGEVNIDNPFTEDDETKLDGIEEEATKNTAGDGIVVADDGETSIDDEYIDDQIESSTHYLDSFRLAYTTSYSTTMGTRWTTQQQSDLTGYVIRINPGDTHVAVLQALREDSKIQVRNIDETVNNSFTLEADPAAPDSAGTWTLFGEWDEPPNLVQSHNYRLLFSVRRGSSIHTDNDTLDGTGTEGDPVKVKDDGIGEAQIDGSMSSADKETVRGYIDASNGVYITPANVAVNSGGTVYTLTTDVPERTGLELVFEAKVDSGGSSVSLRLGSSGTLRSIRRTDGNDIGSGELKNGQLVKATWNGSQYKSNIAPPVGESETSETPDAGDIETDTTDFDGLIPDTADSVQEALEALDDVDAEDIPTNTADFGEHIPTTADNIRKALQALNENEYLFHRTVERQYTSNANRLAGQIAIIQHGGTVYDFHISTFTGTEALPESFLNHLGRLTPIKVISADGTVVWRGVLQSIHDDDETSATLRIDFAQERTGTFTNGETVEISFGVAVLSRLIASAVELSVADFDGLFADFGEDDLQDLLNYIDDLVAQNIPINEDNLEGLLSGLTHLNVQEAFDRVDTLADHDEDNHFFSITPADLGSNKIGYAAAAHTGLNNAGGSNPNHSLVSGIFHEYDADLGYRWHLLYNQDATGISGSDTTYGGPSLHALDGSGATGRIINMFFRVNLLADDELFNPFGSSLDLDPHSDSRINEGLRVFEVRWLSSIRRLRLNRRTNDVSTMSAYWETGTPPESELKDIWLLTENDGLIKIDADWFDDAGDGYAQWNIPESETAVTAAMDGLETNQHCLLVIADEDSVGSTPNYIRAYDDGFYLQLKIGDDPIETKWMRPASYNPGVWHWVSDWEELDSAPTVAGTAYEAAVYDVEGAGQYTASDQVTLHEDVARADQLGLTFVTFRHHLMDKQFRNYTPVQLYPQDGEVVASRRNIYRPRKFIFGRVEGSSNKGLPIPNIDFRSGARGNIDYHQGEALGDDLLPLTTFRLDKGTWRIDVDMNALTRQALDQMSIALLRANTDNNFFIGLDFEAINEVTSARHVALAIDGDGNAYSLQTTNDYLQTIDLETGERTRVGTVFNFGVSENNPQCLAFIEDGTLYFTGYSQERLYTLNTSTGDGTQVGTMVDGYGVNEDEMTSFAAIGNDLFGTGTSNNCIYQMNTTTGGATRIGNVTNFGQGPTSLGATILFPIGDRMFMYGADSQAYYEVDLETGSATLLTEDTNLFASGLAVHNGVIYRISRSTESVTTTGRVLSRSNILDLPVSIGEGIGVPVNSKHNFPGYPNVPSVTPKLTSLPFYTDGTQDFTLVWNLIQGENPEQLDWLGRDFKVSLEKLAA